uniref:Iron-binding zinc finger CDGSH type domain-containing protein n=1 Tax=Mola mola TaxID=94237 RepID=A0A3Q4AU56_MOLML
VTSSEENEPEQPGGPLAERLPADPPRTSRVVAARLPYRVKLSAEKRYAWCACGHSKKQPFCDGAHKVKAPSISPLRFSPDKTKTAMLCACKETKNVPYCDGSHFKEVQKSQLMPPKIP